MSDLELLERLLTSDDRRAMSDAAKDLGMQLLHRDTVQHARVLDVLHSVTREDEFGRGVISALRNVFDAYVGAVDRAARDAELARFADRDGVRDLLVAMYEGHRRPTQIAVHTERAKSQVTALLKELEDNGLVAEDEQSAEDGRARPRVLTTLGLSLARRLAQHASLPVQCDVSATVSVVVECCATLVSRQHVARADLSDILDSKLPTAASMRALTVLAEESQRLGLTVERDATFWHVEAHLQDRVADHLARAAEGDEPSLLALIPGLRERRGRIVVRTSRGKDAWSRLIQKQALEHVEVIGSGEARVDLAAVERPFIVLYDSGIEVRHDLFSSRRHSFIDPAEARWVHTVAQSTVPETFHGAPLDACP